VKYDKNSKRGIVTAGGDGFVELLARHPAQVKVNKDFNATHVVSERHAALVLGQRTMRPLSGLGSVQRAMGVVRDEDDKTFVHAVWASWSSIDVMSIPGLDGQRAADVFRKVGALSQAECSADGRRDSAAQGYSGPYREYGLGILPGKGRPSVGDGTGEWSACQPFMTKPQQSREAEATLALAMLVISHVLRSAAPDVHAAMLAHAYEHAPVLGRAVRYPQQLGEDKGVHLPCHQLAVRATTVPHDTGTRVSAEMVRRAQRASVESGSDLHVDVMDGGGQLGCVAAFACLPLPGSDGDDERPAPDKDLAMFDRPRGGEAAGRYYGLRVQTMDPKHLCLVVLPTHECPHGSIFPDDLNEYVQSNLPAPGYVYVRLLTYPMRGIEAFVEKLGDRECAIAAAAEAVQDQSVKNMLQSAARELRMHV
jgi:hypothetical protein